MPIYAVTLATDVTVRGVSAEIATSRALHAMGDILKFGRTLRATEAREVTGASARESITTRSGDIVVTSGDPVILEADRFERRFDDAEDDEDDDEDILRTDQRMLSWTVPASIAIVMAAASPEEARLIAPFMPHHLAQIAGCSQELSQGPSSIEIEATDRIGETLARRISGNRKGKSATVFIGAPDALHDHVASLMLWGDDELDPRIPTGATEVLLHKETLQGPAWVAISRPARDALATFLAETSAKPFRNGEVVRVRLEAGPASATLRAARRRKVLAKRISRVEDAAIICGHFGLGHLMNPILEILRAQLGAIGGNLQTGATS